MNGNGNGNGNGYKNRSLVQRTIDVQRGYTQQYAPQEVYGDSIPPEGFREITQIAGGVPVRQEQLVVGPGGSVGVPSMVATESPSVLYLNSVTNVSLAGVPFASGTGNLWLLLGGSSQLRQQVFSSNDFNLPPNDSIAGAAYTIDPASGIYLPVYNSPSPFGNFVTPIAFPMLPYAGGGAWVSFFNRLNAIAEMYSMRFTYVQTSVNVGVNAAQTAAAVLNGLQMFQLYIDPKTLSPTTVEISNFAINGNTFQANIGLSGKRTRLAANTAVLVGPIPPALPDVVTGLPDPTTLTTLNFQFGYDMSQGAFAGNPNGGYRY